MRPKADLSQKIINLGDIDYPHTLWCKSGHVADRYMVRDGEEQPMRFFRVTGAALPPEHHGTYCESCLILANKMARSNKSK